MDEVGERFSRAEFFLPDLILAAEATKRAIGYLRPLLGDAAGFADAWTGEGIYFAVKSAVLAHKAIINALVHEKKIECLSTYSKLCNKFICRELNMSYLVSEMFKKFPSLYDNLQYPKVRQLFVPHTQGKISYEKALVKAFLLISGYKLRLIK